LFVFVDDSLTDFSFSLSLIATNNHLGYPSDPKCKLWMNKLHDPVFGYNDFLRFSWATTKQRLKENGVPVIFRADLDDDDELEQQKGMQHFLQKKRKRLGYFEKRNIRVKNSLFG